MKHCSQVVYEKASRLLQATKGLDYPGIIAHHAKAVAKLREVMAELEIKELSAESLGNYAQKPTGPKAGAGDQAQAREQHISDATERRNAITQQMAAEGMSDRTGMLYSSFAQGRRIQFKQAPHKRGIPPFDIVIAPDFAPSPGLHGIFITASEVMSIVLPADDKTNQWTILKRKHYASPEEMSEFIMLLSAGFDLPE